MRQQAQVEPVVGKRVSEVRWARVLIARQGGRPKYGRHDPKLENYRAAAWHNDERQADA
jgi:hypothetical protein